MKNKMNPVVHFEMPAEDSKRMSEFYTKTFGWKANDMGILSAILNLVPTS